MPKPSVGKDVYGYYLVFACKSYVKIPAPVLMGIGGGGAMHCKEKTLGSALIKLALSTFSVNIARLLFKGRNSQLS